MGLQRVRHNLETEQQMVKNLPAVQETWVQSLGWEDPICPRATKPVRHDY